MAASWPIQFTKDKRPGVERCQQSTEEVTIPKKKDCSQYEKNLRPARSFNAKWKVAVLMETRGRRHAHIVFPFHPPPQL